MRERESEREKEGEFMYIEPGGHEHMYYMYCITL